MHIIEDAIKVKRLALIALQLIDPTRRSDEWLEKSSTEAVPKALRLVELTEEFLKRKDAERNARWGTPEGKAKRERAMGANQGKVREMSADS